MATASATSSGRTAISSVFGPRMAASIRRGHCSPPTTPAGPWSAAAITPAAAPDILFQNGNQLGVWLMNSSLSPTWDLLSANTGGWSVVGSGDYNGDGISDILFQNGQQLGVWTESS